jgi:hypothetical protein
MRHLGTLRTALTVKFGTVLLMRQLVHIRPDLQIYLTPLQYLQRLSLDCTPATHLMRRSKSCRAFDR